MRNFIIFFDEKEGSSPLVRLLANHPEISVIRRKTSGVGGWEPFDTFNCGGITLHSLRRCLDLIYGAGADDIDAINRIYCKTARTPLDTCTAGTSVGFKMRLRSPMDIPGLKATASLRNQGFFAPVSYGLRFLFSPAFKRRILRTVVSHDLVVFVTVRQDIFRWALSKYHGDGTGRQGHLQFEVAKGKTNPEDIPRITIDAKRLRRICRKCERIHDQKRHLISNLSDKGIQAYPVFYEDFVDYKEAYFEEILNRLDLSADALTISSMLQQGTVFKKVHSNDISSFVVNHEEITAEFGTWQRYWEESRSGRGK